MTWDEDTVGLPENFLLQLLHRRSQKIWTYWENFLSFKTKKTLILSISVATPTRMVWP